MNRELPALQGSDATHVQLDGVRLLAFHGCGYLGLAHDPDVLAASRAALETYGASGLASRTTTGNLELHERLEAHLADFLKVEAALVIADGYLADLAAVMGLRDVVGTALLDGDAHPSLQDAVRLAGLPEASYGEGDINHAMALLDRDAQASPLVATDGAFAMHGRLAPLPELLRYLPESGHLLVDDSHGVGVLGLHGRGTAEAFGISDRRLTITGSLGKALGSGGGFIAGAAETVAAIRRKALPFIGSTALAPALAAAALAAVQKLDSDSDRLARLQANTGQLHRTARRVGLRSTGTFLPVLRIPFDDYQDARRLSAALHVEGIFAPAMRYPGSAPASASGDATTEGGTVRCAVNSEHTSADIRRLEESLVRHLPEA